MSKQSKLFDWPEPSDAALHQYQVDTLEECIALVAEGKDIPNKMARVLLELLARGGKIPHRPLSERARFARDEIVCKWSTWRKEQIAAGGKRGVVTPAAVKQAQAELEELAKVWGKGILLRDTAKRDPDKRSSLKDRITREPKPPRQQFWYEKK